MRDSICASAVAKLMEEAEKEPVKVVSASSC